MLYKIVLLIHLLGILTVNFMIPGKVSVDVNAPTEIEAGDEATIEVDLNKSDVRSFARFQQKLPGGLEPEVVKNGNAEFRFEDQTVKFIWLKLPQQEEITISYKINVNERLKGSFQLEGSFDYIVDNQRRSIDAGSKTISIQPSASMDPEMLVDVSEFKPLAKAPTDKDRLKRVRCIRQVPYQVEGSKEYKVNLLVNKGEKEKFAKIQEEIPEGYQAVEEEGEGAIFTFKNQTAKFLWMNLPSERIFVISYKLVPENNQRGSPDIEGNFSYIENKNTRKIDIVERDVDLSNREEDHLLSIVNAEKTPAITAEGGLMAEDNELREEEKRSTDMGRHDGKVKVEIAEEAKRLFEKNATLTHKLEPQSGVYYRVQIAAGHRPINVERYFDQYDIDKEVRTELHDGWRKYSVGSFSVYKEARDYRVHVWNTTAIDDAFVAAYNNGDRITVQEALMITNHKWYR
ncbi:MAG: hypothetical protein K9H65_03235 [Bacteroidales bacterium]|nr:hypothetical protein [Bacteroidales bacterium]